MDRRDAIRIYFRGENVFGYLIKATGATLQHLEVMEEEECLSSCLQERPFHPSPSMLCSIRVLVFVFVIVMKNAVDAPCREGNMIPEMFNKKKDVRVTNSRGAVFE